MSKTIEVADKLKDMTGDDAPLDEPPPPPPPPPPALEVPVGDTTKDKDSKKSKSSKRATGKVKQGKPKKSKKKDKHRTQLPAESSKNISPKGEEPLVDSPAGTDDKAVEMQTNNLLDQVEEESKPDEPPAEVLLSENAKQNNEDLSSVEEPASSSPAAEPTASADAPSTQDASEPVQEGDVIEPTATEEDASKAPEQAASAEACSDSPPSEESTETKLSSVESDSSNDATGEGKSNDVEAVEETKPDGSADAKAETLKDNSEPKPCDDDVSPSPLETVESEITEASSGKEMNKGESQGTESLPSEEAKLDELEVLKDATEEVPKDHHEEALDIESTGEVKGSEPEKLEEALPENPVSEDTQALDAGGVKEVQADQAASVEAEASTPGPEGGEDDAKDASHPPPDQDPLEKPEDFEAVTIGENAETSPSTQIEAELKDPPEGAESKSESSPGETLQGHGTTNTEVSDKAEADDTASKDHALLEPAALPGSGSNATNSEPLAEIATIEIVDNGEASDEQPAVPKAEDVAVPATDGIAVGEESKEPLPEIPSEAAVEEDLKEQPHAVSDGEESNMRDKIPSEAHPEENVALPPIDRASAAPEETILEEAPVEATEAAVLIEAPPSPTTSKHRHSKSGWEREHRHKRSSLKGSLDGSSSGRKRRSSGSTSKSAEGDAQLQAAREHKLSRKHRSSSHRTSSDKVGEGSYRSSDRPQIERRSTKTTTEDKKPEKRSSMFRPKLLDMLQAESETGVLLRVNGDKARTRPHTGPRHASERASRPSQYHHHRSRSDHAPSSSQQPPTLPASSSREPDEESSRRERHRRRRREAEEAEEAARRELKKKQKELEEAQREALKARERKKERERAYRYEKGRETRAEGGSLKGSMAKGWRMIFA